MPSEVELERMVVRMLGDDTDYVRMMHDVQRESNIATRAVQSNSAAISSASQSMAGWGKQAIATVGGLAGVSVSVATAFKAVGLASAAEEAEVQFGVMLKTAERGKQMVEDLQKFAAQTPMSLTDLQNATKQLLQFGLSGDEILPTLKMIGDVTGGNAQRFQQMAYVFGQMSSTGRLMGGDLMQMINAGFNPLQVISKQTGKSVAMLKEEMERGRISLKMVQDAFRAASEEGGDFAGLMEKQSHTLGGLFSTMQDDIDGALRKIGASIAEHLDLKGAMQQVSELAQLATELFGSIPAEVKAAAAAIAVGTVAVGVLTVAVILLGKAVTYATGGLSLVTALIAGSIVAAAAGTGALIASLGGIGASLAYVRQQAQAAWDWIMPVRQAISSLWRTIVMQATEAWNQVKATARAVWNSIAGSFSIDWNKLRDGARDAFLMIEFSLLNFKAVAGLAWAFAKYQFVAFANTIAFFFTDQLPAMFDWFKDNWGALWAISLLAPIVGVVALVNKLAGYFDQFLDWLGSTFSETILAIERMFKDMGSGIVNFFKNIGSNLAGLITGDVSLEGLFNSAIGEFKRGAGQFKAVVEGELKPEDVFSKLKIPKRQAGELERQLKDEYEQIKDAVGTSFEEFKAKRLAEFGANAVPEEDRKRIEYEGKEAGAAMNKGLGKELQKFDATLSGTAEAITRLENYKASFEKNAPPPTNAAARAFERNPEASKQTVLQERIAGGIEKLAAKDPVAVPTVTV